MKLNQPALIKIAAIVTASPRWVIALLAAEGFMLPESWLGWWIIISALLSLGMAFVEGFAFSYIFNAWRVQKDKGADRLLWLAILSAGTFVLVMTPSVAASVRQVSIGEVLSSNWILYGWAALVGLSTIVIVAGVGYAEKQNDTGKRTEIKAAKIEAIPEFSESAPGTNVNFPENPVDMLVNGQKTISWREMLPEDKQKVSGMFIKDIMDDFGVSERTARNWRKAAQNGKG